MFKNIVITASGSAIPSKVIQKENFLNHHFYEDNGGAIDKTNTEIVNKFTEITGIEERRYAEENQNTSDLASIAALKAIQSNKVDKETIDIIIVAHNFGDVSKGNIQGDYLPSLATRVKHQLDIKNKKCIAYDLLFGCPGWVQGLIQATQAIKCGDAQKVLVIGSETLSRVVDDHDRDAMIFADGAGAVIIELKEEETQRGVLGYGAETFANEEANYLYSGSSYNKEKNQDIKYIKMLGRKIYEFALTHVPPAIKSVLDKSNVDLADVSKVLLHQANEKMDEAILKRLFRLYKLPIPKDIMPMSIHKLGNNSVATVPVLYDLIVNDNLGSHQIKPNDILIFASVGAGMNINALTYKA